MLCGNSRLTARSQPPKCHRHLLARSSSRSPAGPPVGLFSLELLLRVVGRPAADRGMLVGPWAAGCLPELFRAARVGSFRGRIEAFGPRPIHAELHALPARGNAASLLHVDGAVGLGALFTLGRRLRARLCASFAPGSACILMVSGRGLLSCATHQKKQLCAECRDERTAAQRARGRTEEEEGARHAGDGAARALGNPAKVWMSRP
jgi:hypothetical protein